MKQIIKLNKSIIPSCDFSSLEMLGNLVSETCSIEGIGAYKIGFEIVMKNSLQKVIDAIRDETDLPIIYDHQKAATDIPAMGKNFIKAFKVKDEMLKRLNLLIKHLRQGFKKVTVTHVPREQNRLADREANRALDEELFL